jgi:hypothetical protein
MKFLQDVKMNKLLSILILLFPLITGCYVDQNTLFSFFGKNGYSLLDLGENSRFIVFNGDGMVDMIVIDARVNKHVLRGDYLFVARQPVVAIVSKERGTELKLTPTCEYLKINTKSRTVMPFNPQEMKWTNCF